MSTPKIDLGNWHDGIGSSAENSPNREAPNRHMRGGKKYKEMIAKDTKRIDDHGNMPFSFSKPAKKTRYRLDVYHVCDKCTHISFVSKYRAGQVCGGCRKWSTVNNTNTYHTEEELDAALRKPAPEDD